ncbi:MAG: hypothetical protein Q9172_000642 [Xanthocarpia lactea]
MFCFYVLFYLLASSRALVQIFQSSGAYGPDGPWQTVNVSLGSSGQPVQLLPGGAWASKILSSNVCNNFSSRTPCGTGGLYDPTLSYTVDNTSIDFVAPPTVSDDSGIPAGSVYQAIMEQIQIPHSIFSPYVISNLSIDLINQVYATLPDGSAQYPPQLGSLSLGAPNLNHSFTPGNAPLINASLIPSWFFQAEIIPTNMYGLHIGSAALGIPLSLWLGGYDRSRVIGPVSTQPYADWSFLVDLLDIGIRVDNGASPFQFSKKQNILREGNSSISDTLSVYIDSLAPFLYLPQSTCDAIASYLPVTYESEYKLYFWNTNDSNYERVVTSPSYLAFTFRASNLEQNNITINVPFQLLNLTLRAPIIDTPTQFFPCRPPIATKRSDDPRSGPKYTLGRAFLQAAFIGVHWDGALGSWFLAQAPGPNTASTPQQEAFTTRVNSGVGTWADTWAGHWTPLRDTTSTNPGSSSPAPSEAGLSAGAKAGIGVGCAAAIALFAVVGLYLYRLRSGTHPASEASLQQVANAKSADDHDMKRLETPPIVEAAAPEPAELMGVERRQEIYGRTIHEISS